MQAKPVSRPYTHTFMTVTYPSATFFAVYFKQGKYYQLPCQSIDDGMSLLNQQKANAGELPIGVFDPASNAFQWHPIKLVQINQFSLEHHDRLIEHILLLCKQLTTSA